MRSNQAVVISRAAANRTGLLLRGRWASLRGMGTAVRTDDLDFALPPALIAQRPVEPRDACRLFAVGVADRSEAHAHFRDLPRFLRRGDTLVVNDSRVLAARLFVRDPEDRAFELLLLERTDAPARWRTLVRPGRKVKAALDVVTRDGTTATITREGDTFFVQFPEAKAGDFHRWLETVGVPPLPPYIEREAEATDLVDYQTVFAKAPGSVAAPTAGLHFTDALLHTLRTHGVHIEHVTLHVGYGTFAPVKTERIEDHPMHSEHYAVDADTWRRIETRKKEGHRIVAVGTTALRTLESIPTRGLAASTDILIRPGHRFAVADGLITNFHLPKTTLLALLAAVVGEDRWKGLYEEAIRRAYRFFSYGDAMLCLPFLDPRRGPPCLDPNHRTR